MIISAEVRKNSNKSGNITKYGKYVKFHNEIKGEELYGFYNEYMRGIFDKKNFEKPDEAVISIFSNLNSDTEYMSKIIDKMKKETILKNKSPEELVNALDNEKAVITEIADYYKNGKYRKNNFEKGKQLHQKYMEANKKTIEKYAVYLKDMRELAKEEAERMKSKGLEAGYHMTRFINDVNAFSDKYYSEGEFTGGDITELKKLNQTAKKHIMTG